VVGAGAMGTVYRAVRDDESFEREVAVKVLARALASDELHRRFDQERRLLARLGHPGICALLDAGTTEDGLPFFVMELVRGVPVSEWLRRERRREGGAPDRRTVLALYLEICAA